jgi:hypothetical protein
MARLEPDARAVGRLRSFRVAFRRGVPAGQNLPGPCRSVSASTPSSLRAVTDGRTVHISLYFRQIAPLCRIPPAAALHPANAFCHGSWRWHSSWNRRTDSPYRRAGYRGSPQRGALEHEIGSFQLHVEPRGFPIRQWPKSKCPSGPPKKLKTGKRPSSTRPLAFLPALPARRRRVLSIRLVQGFRRSLRVLRVRHILRADPFIELLRGHIA